MKLSKILATVAIVICLTATATFAAPTTSSSPNAPQGKSDTVKGKHGYDLAMQQDPIKALQSKKEKIQALLKEGKITQEKANAINAKIDLKIKEVQEFNKLTVAQKKDKLISNFKARMAKKVSDGKLTQDKANEIVKKFTEKVEKWDGNGYPQFHKKGFKCKKQLGNENKK